ncbi:MAG: ATP-binding cassette domain-containing protein [Spirochaetales bacterium]|nr:ATP-binding cassette domain-containing protein [Spirochaetales bacterium]
MLTINITRPLRSEKGFINHEYHLQSTPGECLGISGPSGAGKTSLLKMIAGLMLPQSGFIQYNQDLWFDKSKNLNIKPQHRSCGILYQDPLLFPFLTLKENVLYGSKNKELADKYISFLGLEGLKNANIDKLSGGQLKRAALAQLLTYNPDILLLDEPFAFLDERWILKIVDLLFQIRNIEKKIIFIVSHQKDFLASITDRIITISNGKTIKESYINHFSCRKAAIPSAYFSKPAI